MLTLSQVQAEVRKVKYKDWQFLVSTKGDGFLIQVRFLAQDTTTGAVTPQHARKWFLSKFAIPDEVERTCHKALLAAVEHEANEEYTYEGAAIHNPHISPQALIKVAGEITARPEKQL